MSLANAKEMMELLKTDQALRTTLSSINGKDAGLETAIREGTQRGLTFTKQEGEEAMKEYGWGFNESGGMVPLTETVGEEGELSDEALEAVAGGLWDTAGSCSQW
jgi:hypothetical protein